jgi:SAM-dependent methyltransferase
MRTTVAETKMTETSHPKAIPPNAKQREEWNNATGSRWLERHEKIDRQIAPFGRRAMDRVGIQPGQRILDVGCGCGETTIDLARRAGGAGSIIGIDLSAPLIEAARKLAQEAGVSNVRFETADAQTYPFAAESFDLVFSRFGIMFFDDPEVAFKNLRSALRPGGHLAFVCWPAPQENQFVTIPKTAAARHISLPGPGEPNAPGPFAFADTDRVRRILSRSKFTAIEIERLTEKVGGGSLHETTELLLQLGPLGDMLTSLDAETRRSIRADIHSALTPCEASGRVLLDAVAWLVTARF